MTMTMSRKARQATRARVLTHRRGRKLGVKRGPLEDHIMLSPSKMLTLGRGERAIKIRGNTLAEVR
jgi:hypothetical protein